jgi:hypothetical protein
MTKKDQSLALFDEGVQDVETIAEMVGANPTYVATTLMGAGRSIEYQDLYTPSRPRNRYGDDYSGVLRFKNEASARESVQRLEERYRFYREVGDRPGQYQARALALIGYDRAMGLGKTREARIFAEWLRETLEEELMGGAPEAPTLEDLLPPAES